MTNSSNPTSSMVQLERPEYGIAIVKLCRPEKRNALNIALLQQLIQRLEQLQADTECRVVILTGEGSVFCSGMDLIEASQAETAEASASGIRRVLELLCESHLIFIGAAIGGAYAGGAGLLAACDLIIAADDFKIGFPEVRRGLLAALVSAILAQRIRGADLRELLLVAEPVSSQRAHQMGLLHEVCPADQVLDHCLKFARQILSGGPEAIRETKQLINRHAGAIKFGELQALNERMRSGHEAREGLAAFREKRNPDWQR